MNIYLEIIEGNKNFVWNKFYTLCLWTDEKICMKRQYYISNERKMKDYRIIYIYIYIYILYVYIYIYIQREKKREIGWCVWGVMATRRRETQAERINWGRHTQCSFTIQSLTCWISHFLINKAKPKEQRNKITFRIPSFFSFKVKKKFINIPRRKKSCKEIFKRKIPLNY